MSDTEQLLCRENVDQDALQVYAREAADFSTNHQLPFLDFAMNHYGQPDVAMFDFTSMYASENAAMVRQRHGHQLLVTLVGDSLLEVRQVSSGSWMRSDTGGSPVFLSVRSPSGRWGQAWPEGFWPLWTQPG